MIRENTIHTFLFNAFCQWNNLLSAISHTDFMMEDYSYVLRFLYTPGLEHWDLSDPFRDTVEYQTQFWSVIYFCIFVKMYGESWRKLVWWIDLFYRILTGIKEMCLLNLNYFISASSNQDYTEMTTSCQHSTDKWAHEFQPSMYHWSLFGDVIEVFLK